MSFPACRHRKSKASAAAGVLRWLGNEPYRLFFPSATVLSIAGVALWPLYFSGYLGFYPGVSHARVMIECFGGGFVVGFLGTAGPRMLSAPRLTPWELMVLFALHLGSGVCHLLGANFWGDLLFLGVLGVFVCALGGRLIFFRKNWPPPAMLLAGTGLVCGIVGTVLWLNPQWFGIDGVYRVAGLLLYQGFLLGPVMGVGVFLFPRLLGGDFGEPASERDAKRDFVRMSVLAAGLLGSFGIEVWWNPVAGQLVRAAVFVYALAQVRWRRVRKVGEEGEKFASPGTLANAMRFWSLPLAVCGLVAVAFFPGQRVGLEHLLFVTGFGLLCLIACSRVIFGHSGQLAGFAAKSKVARWIVFFAVLAAITRASADFVPKVMESHYVYAAISWAIGASVWTAWHARRFFRRES